MTRSMGMIEARRKLTALPEEFREDPDLEAVAITRRGKPVLALMPWDLYESVIETLEIMGDKELMALVRKGVEDIKHGRILTTEELRRELKL